MLSKYWGVQKGIWVLLLGFSFMLTINAKGCGSKGASEIKAGSSTETNTDVGLIFTPYNLAAVSNSPTQISLSWVDNSDNESGFYIERKTGLGGTYDQIGFAGTNAVSYNDNSVSSETMYYYRIRAYNGQTTSNYSNEANATTGTFPINTPLDLGATVVSSTRIALVWFDNSDNETGFSIERKTGSDGVYFPIASAGQNVSSYDDNSVSPNTTYYYRLEAYNSLTTSNYSNEANGTTPLSVTINAPSNLSASAISPTRIALSWTDNSDNETGFSLERKTGVGGSYVSISSTSQDVASYNDDSVSSETIYYYRIRSYNIDDNSDYSNEANATTQTVGNWTKIFAGFNQSFGCRNDATLWAWGYCDEYGQLGVGSTFMKITPTQVGTASDWDNVTTSWTHSIAIKTNGTIWGAGCNDNGELGTGNTISHTVFTQIGNESNWLTVAVGGDMFYDEDIGNYVYGGHTLAIKTNKTLWVWGWNDWGQLGIGDFESRTTPTKIGITSDWSMVTAFFEQSIALKTNKTMWSWGGNIYGELGVGDILERTTPSRVGITSDWSVVVAGGYHTLALKTNKTIWSWGLNDYGQLGLNDKINRTTPCQVGTASDWSLITAGTQFSLTCKTNGTIWAWGANNKGQLGIANTLLPDSDVIATVISPTQINLVWVDNYNETNFQIHKRFKPISSSDWTNWTMLAGGEVGANVTSFSVNVNTEDYDWQFRVWACLNYAITPKQIGTDSDWVAVKAGTGHALALKKYGTLWAWGSNEYGQLGTGDSQKRSTPTMVGR